MDSKRKKLAIIGGGISGIISAKYALDEGLEVIIFEKNSSLGGIWSENGYAWPEMITNISKYNSSFINYYWQDKDEIFPSKKSVNEYLKDFTKLYNIDRYCKLSTIVTLLTESNNDKFRIEYIESSETKIDFFDYVIIASGFFNKPNYSGFEDYIKNSSIKIIHSSSFKNPEDYRDKKVVIIGHSHSACQIASEIALLTKSVVNLFRKPYWIVPKYIHSEKYDKKIPYDLILFGTKTSRIMMDKCDINESNRIKNNFLSIITEQNKIHSDLFIDPNSYDAPNVAISSNYIELVSNGKIIPKRAEIDEIKSEIILLKDGEKIEADVVILSTGYKLDLAYIDNNIMKKLGYYNFDFENDSKNFELEGYKVYNSNVKNLAMVGICFGNLLVSYELQAKLALMYLLNKKKSQMKINNQDEFSELYNPKDMISLIIKLAYEIGVLPDFEKIKQYNKKLFECLIDGPFLIQQFGIEDKDEYKSSECINYIIEINKCLEFI